MTYVLLADFPVRVCAESSNPYIPEKTTVINSRPYIIYVLMHLSFQNTCARQELFVAALKL